MGLNKVYIKITRENIYKDEFCIKKSLSPTHTDLFGHKAVRLYNSKRSNFVFLGTRGDPVTFLFFKHQLLEFRGPMKDTEQHFVFRHKITLRAANSAKHHVCAAFQKKLETKYFRDTISP